MEYSLVVTSKGLMAFTIVTPHGRLYLKFLSVRFTRGNALVKDKESGA